MRTSLIGCLLLTLSSIAFSYQNGPGETASIEGRVVNPVTGSPLKDAVVALRPAQEFPNQPPAWQMVRQATDDGRFVFSNVPGGELQLSADKRGYVPRVTSITAKGQMSNLTLRLVRQAVIAGRVLDNDGEPVEGARVVLLKAGYTSGAPRWSEAASTVTLDNGDYRIPRVAPGRYLVRCEVTKIGLAPTVSGRETTYASKYYPNATEPSTATPIEVRGDSAEIGGINMRIAPVPVFHVRGRFLPPPDASGSGKPVYLLERSDPPRVFASRDGNVFDFTGIPPGSYLLFAYSMEGHGEFRVTQPVDVSENDVDNLVLAPTGEDILGSLKLKPGGRHVDLIKISVRIHPQGLAGAWGPPRYFPKAVKIGNDLKFRYSLSTELFATFAVTVSDLPEGCYVASVQYGGKDVPDSGIEYTVGAALEIAIGSDGAKVDGKALNKDDNPREGAVVALIPADGKGAARSVKSGPQGAFQITGVPPGDYKLLAWDDASQDEIANPGFVKRFENQATPVKLDANGTLSASIRVITQE